VPLKHLENEKFAAVLCYPRYSQKETSKRIRQLQRLGIEALEFVGTKAAFNVPILGKGNVGLVVIAHVKTGKTAALKIRRVDADRKEMKHEAHMLRIANSLGVGPHLMKMTNDFLLTDLIEGEHLPNWTKHVGERKATNRVKVVLTDILEQCWIMDKAGLDHGELSHAPKHIIVDASDKAHIVDFETASINRRTSNVTSICQYIFMKSQFASIVRCRLGKIDQEALLDILRMYKHRPSKENFLRILKTCMLT
jgi:putative serine/threonine protein kinase